MGRELHYRKKDGMYAIWSTIIDDYITEWSNKETIRRKWYLDKIETAIEDVDRYMEEIDKEV